ncbi:unnamed protein product [Adineta ricciae]|uniref:Uncharacterized protein n=1 Tax=Adineta ricciae TaxID=249248 RepID=A0A815LLJ3_ADIRI|nr:unnamed protein product [Adineta ricciae]CAF1665473.1 unnamed protein product [Adineta ricciae]
MADDEENDPTAPFNELEAFDSLWAALTWTQIKKRVPICFKKTIHNRYFLANFVYLLYAIGIMIIDYDPWINGSAEPEVFVNVSNETSTEITEEGVSIVNKMYLGLAIVHMISAALYWWAWKDHCWNDVIMIPEYLNLVEASLYLWSAVWYQNEDGLYGPYTLALHKLETVAAFVELFASFGWIMSWYRTYTRALGRGFTFEDPDTVAYTLTTLSSFIYIAYNIQILMNPDGYGTNTLYYNGDIIYSIGAIFYLWANLRDDGWLWWMPVAGQYGIAAGRIQSGKPVRAGLPHILMGGNEPCLRCLRKCLRKNPNEGDASVAPVDEKI